MKFKANAPFILLLAAMAWGQGDAGKDYRFYNLEKEYRELKPNVALLTRLAEETGGEVLDPERLEEGLKRLFTPDPGKATRALETWWPLSGIGLFLFLCDLALRRWPAHFSKKKAR